MNRTRAYSVAESALYIGKIIGPLTSGLWAQSFGFGIPYMVAVVATCFNIIYTTFVVEESLELIQKNGAMVRDNKYEDSKPYHREKLELNPLQTFHNLKFIMKHSSYDNEPSPVSLIAVAFFLFHFSLMGWMQVVYIYMKYAYSWNSFIIGLYDSLNGVIQVRSTK